MLSGRTMTAPTSVPHPPGGIDALVGCEVGEYLHPGDESEAAQVCEVNIVEVVAFGNLDRFARDYGAGTTAVEVPATARELSNWIDEPIAPYRVEQSERVASAD